MLQFGLVEYNQWGFLGGPGGLDLLSKTGLHFRWLGPQNHCSLGFSFALRASAVLYVYFRIIDFTYLFDYT